MSRRERLGDGPINNPKSEQEEDGEGRSVESMKKQGSYKNS